MRKFITEDGILLNENELPYPLAKHILEEVFYCHGSFKGWFRTCDIQWIKDRSIDFDVVINNGNKYQFKVILNGEDITDKVDVSWK